MRIRREFIYYLLPLPVVVFSLFVGPAGSVAPAQILAWLQVKASLGSIPTDSALAMVEQVVLNVRLPRIILAFIVGGALTASGTSLQAIVRNPLASPDILGLSAGAAFGAALALSVSWLPVQLMAFVFGLIASLLTYLLALSRRGVSTLSLVLSGIIVGGIFTALLTVIQILNDPFKLQTIVHWTMGNLHNASWRKVNSAILPILCGVTALVFLRWRLNVLALGDEEARSVGLNPNREKLFVLIPAVLVASAATGVVGIIGMVGLAVPHMVRMLVGPDNTRSLPVSLAFGGSFLVLVDDLSRSITTFEIPIGIFTILIGGPFFIYLLKRSAADFGE